MPKNIRLDKEDERILTPLLERNKMNISPHGIVTLYPKIVLRNKVIIHSQDCTRSTRRNDFTISFTDPERPSNLRYGNVRKFLSYPANSAESIHVAIIQELETHCCSELESLQFPPEIQSLSHLLCSDFFSVLNGDNKIAVPVEHILSKCFDVSTVDLCIITPMVCDLDFLK